MSEDQSPAVLDDRGGIDFSRLPTVTQAEDLVDQAFRQGRKAQAPKGAPGERGRNRELARVGAAARKIESALHRVIRSFPSLGELPPFYRELVGVLEDLDVLKQRLGHVEWTRKQVQTIRADAEDEIRDSDNNHEAMQARKEAYGRMASLVDDVTEDLAELERARHELAGLPTLSFDRPILVIAGHPNVGKSSLIEHATRATPEVASYPFTTKGVSLGHRDHERYTVQLMDTPGILDRPMDERNDIERQAVLALEHAADAILYVLDPSGHCGYPLEDQLGTLEELEATFDVPLLVVENKADIQTTGDRARMSCETGEGVEDVLGQALDLAIEAYRERTELGFD
ncbi:GTP-binding protein [Thermoplasmatales archaeon SW_10_69_26]|nr:MAG: GTP-binding protein [Thermoplasmatales archaeon SW_10_69_26]